MRGATRDVAVDVGVPAHFNPRSSCEERRYQEGRCMTRPWNFNPRSSCEERPHPILIPSAFDISIHAPHARSDAFCSSRSLPETHFNPRSSCEERQDAGGDSGLCQRISIHAPHARSDSFFVVAITPNTHFNPRSSCEERLSSKQSAKFKHMIFQSTLLMRGATLNNGANAGLSYLFQSTLLMRGATTRHPTRGSSRYFNPRSSCEERRTRRRVIGIPNWTFQSTLLMRGATRISASDTGRP